MKYSKEQLIQMFQDDDDQIILIEDGEWVQDCKYQFRTSVFQVVGSDDYFMIHEDRSGSYHTDWYYGDPSISKVERAQKTIVVDIWKDLEW